MRVRTCSKRPILRPCRLEGYTHQLDPFVGCEHHCCYCYALNEAETDWDEEVLIHHDLAGQLPRELSALEGQPIYMGWDSDPYQPAEATHCQTRQALEVLAQRGFSACILTKSDLVTRDVDLLAAMPGASAGVSLAFQDEAVRNLFEARAPSNERRVAALRALKEAGVPTYALICPVMPFITDLERLVDMVTPHADSVWVYRLSLEAETDLSWQNVRGILDQHFPALTPQYPRIAFSANHPYWARCRQKLTALQAARKLNMNIRL